MTITALISLLHCALMICGWVCFLIFQVVPEKEKKHEFDNKKFWAGSSIACFVLSFILMMVN